jgi:nucleolar GTP-binding protein
MKKGTNEAKIPTKFGVDPSKNLDAFQKHLSDLGMNGKDVIDRIRERSRSRSRSQSRARSEARSDSQATSRSRSVSGSRLGRKRSRSELDSRGLSVSRAVSQSRAFRDEKQKSTAERLAKRAKTEYSRDGRKGESDRHIFDLKPKHLYSGKRGIGSTDRR